jgi:hypothetical protein
MFGKKNFEPYEITDIGEMTKELKKFWKCDTNTAQDKLFDGISPLNDHIHFDLFGAKMSLRVTSIKMCVRKEELLVAYWIAADSFNGTAFDRVDKYDSHWRVYSVKFKADGTSVLYNCLNSHQYWNEYVLMGTYERFCGIDTAVHKGLVMNFDISTLPDIFRYVEAESILIEKGYSPCEDKNNPGCLMVSSDIPFKPTKTRKQKTLCWVTPEAKENENATYSFETIPTKSEMECWKTVCKEEFEKVFKDEPELHLLIADSGVTIYGFSEKYQLEVKDTETFYWALRTLPDFCKTMRSYGIHLASWDDRTIVGYISDGMFKRLPYEPPWVKDFPDVLVTGLQCWQYIKALFCSEKEHLKEAWTEMSKGLAEKFNPAA